MTDRQKEKIGTATIKLNYFNVFKIVNLISRFCERSEQVLIFIGLYLSKL